MISDLANLGPSLKGLPDAVNSKQKDKGLLDSSKTEGKKTFDQALKDVDQKKVDRDEPRMAREKEPERAEPKTVKKKERSAEGETNKTPNASRSEVMLEFMDSMESEFNIPPARLAEAMTELSDEELASSPEESAPQLIAQLGLSQTDAQRAQMMYLQFLQNLKQTENQSLSTPVMAAGLALPGMAMLGEQDRRAMLNQSLDQMNGRFFMQGQGAANPSAQVAEVVPSTEAEGFGNLEGLRDAASPDRGMSPLGINQDKIPRPQMPPLKEAGAQGKGSASAQSQGNIDLNSMAWKQMEGEQAGLMKKLAALGASAAAIEQGLKTDPKNQQALQAEQEMQAMQLQGTGSEKESALQGAGLGLMTQVEGVDTEDKAGWDTKDGSLPTMDPSQLVRPQSDTAKAGAGAVGASFGALMANRNSDGAQEAQNVQQLMKQAEYIVKKGGGEAKIMMNPEGLGEVHMKIQVKDGNVSLEMNAETKEAKKLIESSLGDLRTTLGQHKLTMDVVKVDVGNQTANDNRNDSSQQQQRQMDMRQDMSRDQARQFWGQFNEGGNRRNAFFDGPTIRGYAGGNKVDPLQSADAQVSSAGRFSTSGKGRGLDLVA